MYHGETRRSSLRHIMKQLSILGHAAVYSTFFGYAARFFFAFSTSHAPRLVTLVSSSHEPAVTLGAPNPTLLDGYLRRDQCSLGDLLRRDGHVLRGRMETTLAGGTDSFGAQGRVREGLGTVDGEEGRKNPCEGVPGRAKVRVSSALTRKTGQRRGSVCRAIIHTCVAWRLNVKGCLSASRIILLHSGISAGQFLACGGTCCACVWRSRNVLKKFDKFSPFAASFYLRSVRMLCTSFHRRKQSDLIQYVFFL